MDGLAMTSERFDVVIVEVATRKIASIIGKDMTEDKAERRVELGLTRTNDNYYVDTVVAGTAEVGKVLEKNQ